MDWDLQKRRKTHSLPRDVLTFGGFWGHNDCSLLRMVNIFRGKNERSIFQWEVQVFNPEKIIFKNPVYHYI